MEKFSKQQQVRKMSMRISSEIMRLEMPNIRINQGKVANVKKKRRTRSHIQ